MKPKVRRPRVGDVYEKKVCGARIRYIVNKIERRKKMWWVTDNRWVGKLVAECTTNSYRGRSEVLAASLSKRPYKLVKEGRG